MREWLHEYSIHISSFLFLPPVGGHVLKRNEANLPADAWTAHGRRGKIKAVFASVRLS
jgi:hypothetical protein